MKRTRLEPFEVQSLTNTRECLIENVVCRWLEHLDETYIRRSAHSTMKRHIEEEECAKAKEEKLTPLGPNDDTCTEPSSSPTIERGSDGVDDENPQPPYYLSTAHKGHALLFLHDFGLLHAAAMFNEPSMLADAIELRLHVGTRDEELSSYANTCTSRRRTPGTPPMSIFAKHVHTLWVVTGLADFWAGTEDGEHYTCVVIRVRNKSAMERLKSPTDSDEGRDRDRRAQDEGPPLTSYPHEGSQASPPSSSFVPRENEREDSSAASLGDAARCGSSVYGLTPSSCHPTPLSEGSDNAFPSVPILHNAPPAVNHTEHGGGDTDSIVEVFSFDSSGDKRALLPSRLARLVASALAMSPSLKNWFAEARGVQSFTREASLAAEVCVGNVPVWAWRHSPRQMSAVGCGVFMCAHLEAFAKIWCNDRGADAAGNDHLGVKRGRDLKPSNGGVSAVMPSLEELVRAIRAHQDHRPTTLLRIGKDLSSPTRVLTSSTAASGQEQRGGAATAGERYLALFYGELGAGPSFESGYRKYMTAALGY